MVPIGMCADFKNYPLSFFTNVHSLYQFYMLAISLLIYR